MNTIVVAPSELAAIWQCNVRTVKSLDTAGIVVRIGPAKLDLLESTKNYIVHLRRVASGLTTVDSKKAAMEALTNLRNAQRFSIEQKQKDYVLISDVNQVFIMIANKCRERVLQFPQHLRHNLEDANPMLFWSARDAIALEDSIDFLVCELLSDISRIGDKGMGEFDDTEEGRIARDASSNGPCADTEKLSGGVEASTASVAQQQGIASRNSSDIERS